MSIDRSFGSSSLTRRIARGLFPLAAKMDDSSPNWKAPPSNCLVPQMQAQTQASIPVATGAHDMSTMVPQESKPACPPVTNTMPSRRLSRSNLFGLFSRPKVERARGFHEGLGKLQHLEVREPTDSLMDSSSQTTLPNQLRSVLRVKSASKLGASSQKQSQQPELTMGSASSSPDDDWDPPPLFQSFPQAIRHGNLNTISQSIESALCQHQYKKNNGAEASSARGRLGFVKELQSESTHDLHKSRNECPGLASKTLVLVTSGRLVQYASSGQSDRMPERILRLGPKSAAFACDLIPGKHWVIHLARDTTNLDQSTLKISRFLLSRLKVPGTMGMARRHVNAMLLICSSPREMADWLQAFRDAIERLGGQKRTPEPELSRIREREQRQKHGLSQTLSHRFLVQHNTNLLPIPRRASASSVAVSGTVRTSALNAGKRLSSAPSVLSVSSLKENISSKDLGNLQENETKLPTMRSRKIDATNHSTAASNSSAVDLFRLEPLKETSRFYSSSVMTSRASEADINTTAPTSLCSSFPPSPGPLQQTELGYSTCPDARMVKNMSNTSVVSHRQSALVDARYSTRLVARRSTQSLNTGNGLRPLHVLSKDFHHKFQPSTGSRCSSATRAMMAAPIPEGTAAVASANYFQQNIVGTPFAHWNRSSPSLGRYGEPLSSSRQRSDSFANSSQRVRPFPKPLPIKIKVQSANRLIDTMSPGDVPTAINKPMPIVVSHQTARREAPSVLNMAENSESSMSEQLYRVEPKPERSVSLATSVVPKPIPLVFEPIVEEKTAIESNKEFDQASMASLESWLRVESDNALPRMHEHTERQQCTPLNNTVPAMSESWRMSSASYVSPTTMLLWNLPSSVSSPSLTRHSSKTSLASPSDAGMMRDHRGSSTFGTCLTSAEASPRASSPFHDDSRRCSSVTSAASPTASICPSAAKLKRPASLQIRIDHAPFLSSRYSGSATHSSRSSSLSLSQQPALFSGPHASRVLSTLQPSSSRLAAPLTKLREVPETRKQSQCPLDDDAPYVATINPSQPPSTHLSGCSLDLSNPVNLCAKSPSLSVERSVSLTESDLSDLVVLETVSQVRLSVYASSKLVTTDIPPSPASLTFSLGDKTWAESPGARFSNPILSMDNRAERG